MLRKVVKNMSIKFHSLQLPMVAIENETNLGQLPIVTYQCDLENFAIGRVKSVVLFQMARQNGLISC